MHRYRAPSIAPGTFFIAQSCADFIINMSESNLRQAQLLRDVNDKEKPLRGAANRFLFLLPATAAETEPNARAAAIITVTRAATVVTRAATVVTRAAAIVAIATTHIIAIIVAITLNIPR